MCAEIRCLSVMRVLRVAGWVDAWGRMILVGGCWWPVERGASSMGPQAGREVRPMRDLTVRATSCYHSASKEIWLGLGLRYERVTMLNAA